MRLAGDVEDRLAADAEDRLAEDAEDRLAADAEDRLVGDEENRLAGELAGRSELGWVSWENTDGELAGDLRRRKRVCRTWWRAVWTIRL